MQTVVGKIAHITCVDGLDTDKLPTLLIVGDREAYGINALKTCTFYGHCCGITRSECAARHVERYFTGERIGIVVYIDSILKTRSHYRDVVGINEIIAVYVAYRHITFEIGITTTQTGIVGVGGQVILIYSAVRVDITGEIALRTGHLEHIQFASGTIVSYTFRGAETDVTCLGLILEYKFLDITVALPYE